MLLLTFRAGSQDYAINTRNVLEVIPIVEVRKLPGTPDYVRGVLNYRGRLVPVVDITWMIAGRASMEHLSSRIILVRYPEKDDSGNVLGLLVEHATSTVDRKTETFAASGVDTPGMPWMGKISVDGESSIQIVKIEDLLADELKTLLFAAPAGKSL
ncbi:MAG TPA: chemotaxis protein CheW [Lentisphaeria bacterium]|nr:MAG: hypothetical protein A2X45_20845 [Lentisphaerae bacterium GWF2_50_93]HCE44680.1 chemotaxis protein CheW [Lentisphaeria bacterium]